MAEVTKQTLLARINDTHALITAHQNQKIQKKELPSGLMMAAIWISVLLFLSSMAGGISLFALNETTTTKAVERFFTLQSTFTTIIINVVAIIALCYFWRYVFFNAATKLKEKFEDCFGQCQ